MIELPWVFIRSRIWKLLYDYVIICPPQTRPDFYLSRQPEHPISMHHHEYYYYTRTTLTNLSVATWKPLQVMRD